MNRQHAKITPELIKELRVDALIETQTEFAKRLNSTPQQVGRWELGHMIPSARNKRKLAELMKQEGLL